MNIDKYGLDGWMDGWMDGCTSIECVATEGQCCCPHQSCFISVQHSYPVSLAISNRNYIQTQQKLTTRKPLDGPLIYFLVVFLSIFHVCIFHVSEDSLLIINLSSVSCEVCRADV